MRLIDADTGVHFLLWFVLIAGGVVTIIFTIFFMCSLQSSSVWNVKSDRTEQSDNTLFSVWKKCNSQVYSFEQCLAMFMLAIIYFFVNSVMQLFTSSITSSIVFIQCSDLVLIKLVSISTFSFDGLVFHSSNKTEYSPLLK